MLPVMLNIEGDLGLSFLPGTASSLTPPPYTASSGIFHPLRVQLCFLASSALLFRGDCRNVCELMQTGCATAGWWCTGCPVSVLWFLMSWQPHQACCRTSLPSWKARLSARRGTDRAVLTHACGCHPLQLDQACRQSNQTLLPSLLGSPGPSLAALSHPS